MLTLFDKSVIRILIIKTGYSETLSPETDDFPSLGDILRSTPVLKALVECFPKAQISWLTSPEAVPLLEGNPYIERLITAHDETIELLKKERFDLVYNLEKSKLFLEMTSSVQADSKFGFLPTSNGEAYQIAGHKSDELLHYIHNKDKPIVQRDVWQKLLIEILGIPWNGQRYSSNGNDAAEPAFDVGLSYQVGRKWQSKAMPLELWKSLERYLSASGFSVSWQQGFDNLNHYLSWIQSCRTLISHDSLGLHVALSYRVPVIGLFGPTSPQEIYFYNQGVPIVADSACEKRPCYQSQCTNDCFCMEKINVTQIAHAVDKFITEKERFRGKYWSKYTSVNH